MMQTRSMVNNQNLTMNAVPYVATGDEQTRKRKRVPKALDYKSIIQTRSQKLLEPVFVTPNAMADTAPVAVPSGGDSNPPPGYFAVFLTISLLITALGAIAWFYT